MKTLREALAAASRRLQEAAAEEPSLSAQWLLAHVLGADRSVLFRDEDLPLSEDQFQAFESLVEQRMKHVPVAYLLGRQEFYGLNFRVTPEVLIPRPETELLVDKALEQLNGLQTPTLIDVGTGSGNIAVAVAKNHSHVRILALDRSVKALYVGRENAKQHGVEGRVMFAASDLLRSVANRHAVDGVAANPPYIDPEERSHLPIQVSRYEPSQALFSPSGDSIFYHKEIAFQAAQILRPGGFLIMELGQGQAEAVVSVLRVRGYEPIRVFSDYAGIPRVVLGTLIAT